MKVDFLNDGDLVYVISPGSRAKPDNVNKAIETLKSWNLRVELLNDQFGDHPYLSNTDDIRFRNLKKALLSSEAKAIWCTRGGYGSARLLPQLKNLNTPKNFKWIIGYSDVTALHQFANQKWKWPVLHGPLLETLAENKIASDDILATRDLLFGRFTQFQLPLISANKAAHKKQKINASLCGGNLTVLQCSCGTFYQLNSKNKILVLEDIGERGYRIDRALNQMVQSGSLDQCLAIVVGQFSGGQEPDGNNFVQRALSEFYQSTKIPCFTGLPMGHGDRNFPLPLGVKVRLEVGSEAQLIIENKI
jgi:muramoyltetrapeptide carboxypeptidase